MGKNFWLYQAFIEIYSFYKYIVDMIFELCIQLCQFWKDWTYTQCKDWYLQEKQNPPNFTEVGIPPCTLEAALEDINFKPDPICHSGRGYCYYFHRGAYHCVMSREPSISGHAQQACYNKEGKLLGFRRG